jgi:hypothetical protein
MTRVPVVFLTAAVLFAAQTISAQQAPAATNASNAAAKKSPRHRIRPAEVQPPPPAEDPTPAPPQPELPKWPVNETPAKPTVTWDSSGLKIQANNASLHEILDQVSTDTGAKVEGMAGDERVFGDYGPGTARDVISQLLHGSGYNVLMIGDQGAGTPRQIVLSTRRAANASQANRASQPEQPEEDIPEQPEVEEQPPQQPPMMNGRPPMMVPPGPPGAPRTPQQILQELQQRQQQIQDQQQQQQPH